MSKFFCIFFCILFIFRYYVFRVIKILGQQHNSDLREEEYDMLDIDMDRPPTKITHLAFRAIE